MSRNKECVGMETSPLQRNESWRQDANASVFKEDDDIEDYLELEEEIRDRAHSFCSGIFECIIVSEAQKIKSILTVTHKSV